MYQCTHRAMYKWYSTVVRHRTGQQHQRNSGNDEWYRWWWWWWWRQRRWTKKKWMKIIIIFITSHLAWLPSHVNWRAGFAIIIHVYLYKNHHCVSHIVMYCCCKNYGCCCCCDCVWSYYAFSIAPEVKFFPECVDFWELKAIKLTHPQPIETHIWY